MLFLNLYCLNIFLQFVFLKKSLQLNISDLFINLDKSQNCFTQGSPEMMGFFLLNLLLT